MDKIHFQCDCSAIITSLLPIHHPECYDTPEICFSPGKDLLDSFLISGLSPIWSCQKLHGSQSLISIPWELRNTVQRIKTDMTEETAGCVIWCEPWLFHKEKYLTINLTFLSLTNGTIKVVHMTPAQYLKCSDIIKMLCVRKKYQHFIIYFDNWQLSHLFSCVCS